MNLQLLLSHTCFNLAFKFSILGIRLESSNRDIISEITTFVSSEFFSIRFASEDIDTAISLGVECFKSLVPTCKITLLGF
jgi:hypothetical protein